MTDDQPGKDNKDNSKGQFGESITMVVGSLQDEDVVGVVVHDWFAIGLEMQVLVR